MNVLQTNAVYDIVKNFTADYDKPLIFDKVGEGTDSSETFRKVQHLSRIVKKNKFNSKQIILILQPIIIRRKIIDAYCL